MLTLRNCLSLSTIQENTNKPTCSNSGFTCPCLLVPSAVVLMIGIQLCRMDGRFCSLEQCDLYCKSIHALLARSHCKILSSSTQTSVHWSNKILCTFNDLLLEIASMWLVPTKTWPPTFHSTQSSNDYLYVNTEGEGSFLQSTRLSFRQSKCRHTNKLAGIWKGPDHYIEARALRANNTLQTQYFAVLSTKYILQMLMELPVTWSLHPASLSPNFMVYMDTLTAGLCYKLRGTAVWQ